MTDKHVARLQQIQQMQPSYDVKSGIWTQPHWWKASAIPTTTSPFPVIIKEGKKRRTPKAHTARGLTQFL